jgi:hypothetical protein
MTPILTGDRCRCTACGLYFLTTDDFDRHRIGRVGTNSRRCRTVNELAARGWKPKDHWFLTRRPDRTVTAADSARLIASRHAP